MKHIKLMAPLLLVAAALGPAHGALPAPTAAQAEAAAAKKAQAQVQAEKDKQALLASMDALSTRWRAHAAEKGLPVHAPVALAAPASALTEPARQSGSSGQPGGRMGADARAAPMQSEKSGTAAPSEDVKQAPSRAPADVKTAPPRAATDVKTAPPRAAR